jgi:hypothetical protein
MDLIDPLRRALAELHQLPARLDGGLQQRLGQPLPGLRRAPIRPAEVGRKLEKIMLARENMLEDANYRLVVPNEYVVAVNPALYDQGYHPIEAQLCEQWQTRLLDRLVTANSRIGEKKYRFGGPVRVRIEPAASLAATQVEVRGQIGPGAARSPVEPVAPPAIHPVPDSGATRQLVRPSCLALLPAGPRYPLPEGVAIIGRDAACDIHLDQPEVQQRHLIGARHAYVRCQRGTCRLYDGTPAGHRSAHGTYVNAVPLGPEGRVLHDGDVVVLGATDPTRPRPDVPGAAGFIFYVDFG